MKQLEVTLKVLKDKNQQLELQTQKYSVDSIEQHKKWHDMIRRLETKIEQVCTTYTIHRRVHRHTYTHR